MRTMQGVRLVALDVGEATVNGAKKARTGHIQEEEGAPQRRRQRVYKRALQEERKL